MNELEMLEELRKIDTPTITNVVATYPGQEYCLGLYNPWSMNWYTDNRLECWYPELGPIAGYAVTAVYSEPDPNYPPLDFMQVLEEIDASPKPAIFVFEQRFSPENADKVGLAGGNMTSKMLAVGAIGAITNGPTRDRHEIRPMKFQYMSRGLCAGHGKQAIQAIQVPVHICGMDIAPGEIVHMDENGAVKFPANKLEAVLKNAKALLAKEDSDIGKVLEVRGKGLKALKEAMVGTADPYMGKR
ncbi:MAG: RraA family protein [Rhodospirillales bacterium]